MKKITSKPSIGNIYYDIDIYKQDIIGFMTMGEGEYKYIDPEKGIHINAYMGAINKTNNMNTIEEVVSMINSIYLIETLCSINIENWTNPQPACGWEGSTKCPYYRILKKLGYKLEVKLK